MFFWEGWNGLLVLLYISMGKDDLGMHVLSHYILFYYHSVIVHICRTRQSCWHFVVLHSLCTNYMLFKYCLWSSCLMQAPLLQSALLFSTCDMCNDKIESNLIQTSSTENNDCGEICNPRSVTKHMHFWSQWISRRIDRLHATAKINGQWKLIVQSLDRHISKFIWFLYWHES